MTQAEMGQVIQQHTIEIAEIRQVLAQIAQQQAQIAQQQAITAEQQSINMQQIALNTAGLIELRGILADYLRGRSQLES